MLLTHQRFLSWCPIRTDRGLIGLAKQTKLHHSSLIMNQDIPNSLRAMIMANIVEGKTSTKHLQFDHYQPLHGQNFPHHLELMKNK